MPLIPCPGRLLYMSRTATRMFENTIEIQMDSVGKDTKGMLDTTKSELKPEEWPFKIMEAEGGEQDGDAKYQYRPQH
jgi:hypothetical protein